MEKGSCATKTSCGTGGGCGPSCTCPKCAGGKCATKSCCWSTLFKGAIIGGVVIFFYYMASWMLIPWHKSTMNGFADQQAVADVLLTNAPKSGVYTLPFTKDMNAPQAVEKPFAFVSVLVDGHDMKKMGPQMGRELILCLFGAGLLTCMLMKASGCPTLFSFKTGLLIGLAAHVPMWNWFHFPLDYTLVGVADNVIATTLAGTIIGKLVLKKPMCDTQKCDTDKKA